MCLNHHLKKGSKDFTKDCTTPLGRICGTHMQRLQSPIKRKSGPPNAWAHSSYTKMALLHDPPYQIKPIFTSIVMRDLLILKLFMLEIGQEERETGI